MVRPQPAAAAPVPGRAGWRRTGPATRLRRGPGGAVVPGRLRDGTRRDPNGTGEPTRADGSTSASSSSSTRCAPRASRCRRRSPRTTRTRSTTSPGRRERSSTSRSREVPVPSADRGRHVGRASCPVGSGSGAVPGRGAGDEPPGLRGRRYRGRGVRDRLRRAGLPRRGDRGASGAAHPRRSRRVPSACHRVRDAVHRSRPASRTRRPVGRARVRPPHRCSRVFSAAPVPSRCRTRWRSCCTRRAVRERGRLGWCSCGRSE